MRMLKRAAAAAIVAMLIVALAGCSMIAQKAVENATGVKVDQSGKNVTVTGQNGQTASVSSEGGKLPDGLPSDVPAYSGTIASSARIATDQGVNYTFQITTSDDAATVQSWYKDQLTSKGWKVTGTVTSGADQAMVTATKTDKNNILVTIGKNSSDGKTEVNVVADFKK